MSRMFAQRVKLHARIAFCRYFQFRYMRGKKRWRFHNIMCNPVGIGVDEAL